METSIDKFVFAAKHTLLFRVVFSLAMLLLMNAAVFAQDYDIDMTMNGAQAGIASSGTGTETGSGYSGCYYTSATKVLTITFQYSGLTGTTTAAHIHGPALAGASAGVVFGFSGFVTGVTSGSYANTFVLNATQETDLLAGKYYINIHTSFAGGGEIRGQLNIGGLLPVELVSFTATTKGKSVELKWNTATEVNNYGFEIERKIINNEQLPMNSWQKIGFVEGSGTTNAPKSYNYIDVSAQGSVAYRLKQIDHDGQFEYSDVVETATAEITDFRLDQNYPNPFNPFTVISYQLPMNSHVLLSVYDALGREAATLVNETKEAGTYSVQFDGSKLSSGLYFYTLRASNFIATKKLTVMK